MRRVAVKQKKYLGICPTTRKALYEFPEYKGFFHTWGVSSCEDSDGNMIDSYAIIELDDGTIELAEPQMVRFLDRSSDEKIETSEV